MDFPLMEFPQMEFESLAVGELETEAPQEPEESIEE